jgi:diaminohydroxyphosphoribosylaminopyrimidine deaminase/5-amino-6-(5-phosphoribosylamino)uracil reductase
MMRAALGLAARNLGQTWPNPSVGCVLVRDGAVVGRGWTEIGGRPHAETEAIRRAGAAASGATAYVTLEPCNHVGRTGPCSLALIAAGVSRVVVAIEDPDPRVSGGGIARLRDAGIEVSVGLLADEALALNEGFFTRLAKGRPMAALKLATSLDGRIATGNGASQWVTGEAARARGHLLRAEYDAIMVGTGTVLADDPSLDCRLPGLASRSPVRIVLDRQLRLDLGGNLGRRATDHPTWVVTSDAADAGRRAEFEAHGFAVIAVGIAPDGRLDLLQALREFGARGITRLLVEGGGKLAASLVAADLVDRLHWFRAPSLIGGDGREALAALGLSTPDAAPRFVLSERTRCGVDVLETYRAQR